MKSICVYTGSSPGALPEYTAAAKQLATALVVRDITLIYGGGNVGLMGILADAVMSAGGKAIGVIPQHLAAKELAHEGISELRVVSDMHERKATMAELSEGVLALPGGLGTLEELFEMLTWAQLGLHKKPCGLLNVKGYFDFLLSFLDHAKEQRFVSSEHRDLLLRSARVDELLDRMMEYTAPNVEKWLDRET